MTTSYATKQAADRLQISPNTLRNWSDAYGDHLSEAARPGTQPERRFTEHDLTILEYIKQLRAEGMEKDQIRQRLGETQFADVEVLKAPTTTLQAPTDSLVAPSTQPPDTLQAPQLPAVVLEAVLRRLDAAEADAKANRAEVKYGRQRDTLVFLLGLTAGIVLCVGLLFVAALLMR